MIQNFKLGELFEIQLGKTPARGNKKMWDQNKKSNNIWLSIKDLNQADADGYISDSAEYLSDNGAKLVKLIPENTLLLSFKLTLGRTAITKIPLRTNEAIAALIPKTDKCNIKYLKYYFEFFDFIKFASNDFKVKGLTLNKNKLANIPIPVPSLQEQEKVVESLDKASSLINQNIEILNKSLEKLTDTRERTINELFNSFENFINWEEAATLVRGPFGGSLTKKMFVNKGYAVYEQRNAIRNNTKEFRYFVNKDKYLELKRFAVVDNDLIMSCSGTIGKVTKIDKNFKEGIINQALLKITPLNSEEAGFMLAWMSSNHFKDQLKTKGAAQTNIVSVKEIKKIKYPVAKKNQIDETIKQVDRIKSISHKLNKLYEMKLSSYKKLFQSILQKDFYHE